MAGRRGTSQIPAPTQTRPSSSLPAQSGMQQAPQRRLRSSALQDILAAGVVSKASGAADLVQQSSQCEQTSSSPGAVGHEVVGTSEGTTDVLEVLKAARPTWSDLTLLDAEAKLAQVGILTIKELAEALRGHLNTMLRDAGLKAFKAETLRELRKVVNTRLKNELLAEGESSAVWIAMDGELPSAEGLLNQVDMEIDYDADWCCQSLSHVLAEDRAVSTAEAVAAAKLEMAEHASAYDRDGGASRGRWKVVARKTAVDHAHSAEHAAPHQACHEKSTREIVELQRSATDASSLVPVVGSADCLASKEARCCPAVLERADQEVLREPQDSYKLWLAELEQIQASSSAVRAHELVAMPDEPIPALDDLLRSLDLADLEQGDIQAETSEPREDIVEVERKARDRLLQRFKDAEAACAAD